MNKNILSNIILIIILSTIQIVYSQDYFVKRSVNVVTAVSPVELHSFNCIKSYSTSNRENMDCSIVGNNIPSASFSILDKDGKVMNIYSAESNATNILFQARSFWTVPSVYTISFSDNDKTNVTFEFDPVFEIRQSTFNVQVDKSTKEIETTIQGSWIARYSSVVLDKTTSLTCYSFSNGTGSDYKDFIICTLPKDYSYGSHSIVISSSSKFAQSSYYNGRGSVTLTSDQPKPTSDPKETSSALQSLPSISIYLFSFSAVALLII
ncbi:hypothetical protein CYY_006628 [Polysphondylium violaceum]|uniref:Carbohydrate binding domain-containing protein n=1 Tax=Polysphondylium violaceum TaxID=133409 RepID=A0A8J4V2Y8_9MYCE|nr:hypothetical protein CYY_006628 [Polysphondylium violaceum]